MALLDVFKRGGERKAEPSAEAAAASEFDLDLASRADADQGNHGAYGFGADAPASMLPADYGPGTAFPPAGQDFKIGRAHV